MMPGSIRLFVSAPLFAGAEIPALPGQAHYLGAVMRRAAGDAVVLFNGADGEWRARIAAIRRDQAMLVAEAQLRPQLAEPGIVLAFALLKRDTTNWLVEKATELGVAVLQPLLTARTQSERVNLSRLAIIATEAAEQCERLSVPVLHPPRRLGEFLADWPADKSLAVAMERSDAAPPGAPAAGLLVGPEGGFTAGELDGLRRLAFVVPISLGPRILRAETAALAGLALLGAQAGQ